jgi:hypothetical protein
MKMLKNLKNHIAHNDRAEGFSSLVDTFINTQQSLHALPELSSVEKVQFEQEIAISHLYHSSKIEGTNLNTERLSKAIHA